MLQWSGGGWPSEEIGERLVERARGNKRFCRCVNSLRESEVSI